jgi:hypothetical protein
MQDTPPSAQSRPLRVLNLIDGLGGGGSERLLWDTVRLTDPALTQHLVSTASPDWFGDFHYAARLRAAGAYGSGRSSGNRPVKIPRCFTAVRNFMRTPNPENRIGTAVRFIVQLAALVATFPGSVIALLRHRPDVVHCHTFYSFVHGIALGLIFRVPVVHTVPCLFQQMRTAGFSWLPWCYGWASIGVRTFFTGASVEELRTSGIASHRIVRLAGGVDLEPIHAIRKDGYPLNLSARTRLGLPAEALIALNIGRLHESKGQRHAIAALALVADEFPLLHLVILGEGKLHSELTRFAKSLRIEDRVHFAGFWEDPLEVCAAADIYLRTNLFEGDNLSSLQAIGLGVPVAGFETGQAVDVVRTAGAGDLVPVGDEPKLANAIRRILSSEDRGAHLGRAGAAYVDEHLGISSMLHAYETAYQEARKTTSSSGYRMKGTLLWLAKFAVTAAVMTLVFTRLVDWPTLTRAASSFPLPALGIILVLHLLQRVVGAWQTQLALRHAGIPVSTLRVFHVHLLTSFFSVVLPGELAGAAVSWHLFSRDSGRRSQTAAALIYLRLIGFFMLVAVGAVGLWAEPRLIAMNAHWAVLGAAIVIGLPLLSFHSRKFADGLKSWSDVVTGLLPSKRLRSAFVGFWSSVHEFTAMRRPTQGCIWLAAVAVYSINVVSGLVAMQAAGITAPATAIVWLLAIVTLISLVPFTFGGFGVRELGVAVLLKQWYGVPTETAVLLSLALGSVALIASVGFGGIALLAETIFFQRKSLPPANPEVSVH